MDKFQDAYRQAAEGLPHISMDAEKIREGLPRQAQRVRRYLIARGCTAAVVFLLCGVGTAAASYSSFNAFLSSSLPLVSCDVTVD